MHASTLFDRANISESEHLAQMLALLGPAPADFLRRGAFAQRYFVDAGGRFPGARGTLVTFRNAQAADYCRRMDRF